MVLGATAFRAVLIWFGLYLVDRKDKHLVKKALAAAGTIEVFVIWYTWWQAQKTGSSAA